FRCPNRHWMEVSFAIAVLAGFAVDNLLRSQARAVALAAQWTATALTLICLIAGIAVLCRTDLAERWIRALPDLDSLPRGFLQQARTEFYLPIISATCLSIAIIVFARSARRHRWYPLLLALLVIDYNLYSAFAPIINKPGLESLVGSAIPKELAAEEN